MFFFLLFGNNNFIESWPAVLAQPDQTRWGCSNKGSWNTKHKRGHVTTASPSLPWLHKLQPAAPLHGCVLPDHNCSALHEVDPGCILPTYGCLSTAAKLSKRSCLRFHLSIERPLQGLIQTLGRLYHLPEAPVFCRSLLKGG